MTKNRTTGRARRPSPGTVAGLAGCLLATLGVVGVAMQARPAAPSPVTYTLPGETVVAITDFEPAMPPDPAGSLDRFYRTGDARHLNYAEAALDAARSHDVSDAIARIRLESAGHRFLNAATLAGRVLEKEPRQAEARLLRADALRRTGDLQGARRDCLALGLVSDPVAGHWCAIQVLLSEGKAAKAFAQARDLANGALPMETSMQRWYAEIAAEAAALAGADEAAGRIYRQLAARNDAVFSARLAYADLLLRTRQPGAVLEVLDGDRGTLPAQVRIAIAAKQLGLRPDPDLRAAIDGAFAGMSPDDSSDLKLRDRAIFELRFNEDADAALEYALANWTQQKGPEDLSLLDEAAAAAGNEAAMNVAASWRSRFVVEPST